MWQVWAAVKMRPSILGQALLPSLDCVQNSPLCIATTYFGHQATCFQLFIVESEVLLVVYEFYRQSPVKPKLEAGPLASAWADIRDVCHAGQHAPRCPGRKPGRPTNWKDDRLGYRIKGTKRMAVWIYRSQFSVQYQFASLDRDMLREFPGAPGWNGSPHTYTDPIRWSKA